MTGTVYTETVVHLAPEAFAKDVPYQVAIVSLEDGSRITSRIVGERVAIDDRVERPKQPHKQHRQLKRLVPWRERE